MMSTSGYVLKYCGGPISWCSKKQPVMALSSTEAEFIAIADCCKELLYVQNLIEELLGIRLSMHLHVDNQSAIQMAKNGIYNKRSKHIDVRYHFVKEKITENNIEIKYCESAKQPADIFTKALNNIRFEQHRNVLVS